MASDPSMAVVRALLSDKETRSRYQNPKLQTRKDVARPFYFIRYSVQGRRKSQFLGFVDETPAREAKERRAEILKAVNASRLLIQCSLTFGQICERFLEVHVPQLGAATQAKYRTQIANHILPEFGKMKLCEIDGSIVEQWLMAKKTAGLGWWTRNSLKAAVSAIFTTAKRWKLWEGDNVTIGVRIGRKREAREKRVVTADQLCAILAAVSEQTRFMILIGLLAGLRVSEIVGLRWGDIDFTAGTLTVKRRWYRGDLDEPKTQASERTRQLGPLVQEFQRRYPGPLARDQYIFLGDNGHTPVDERNILRYDLRPALKRLGLYYPGMGWHVYRRMFFTWKQQVGATPLEAMKAGGHTSLDMTLLYTLNDPERERAHVQAMFDKLMDTPDGPKQ